MSLNRVSLIGHVGKPPRFFQTDEGDAYSFFSLATSERWTDSKGHKHTRTRWHQVGVFSARLVEILRAHVRQGSFVFVEGMLRYHATLTDDGRTQTVAQVRLTYPHGLIRVLDFKRPHSHPSEAPQETAVSSRAETLS